MTDWATFAGVAGVVTLAVLVLATLSQDAVPPTDSVHPPRSPSGPEPNEPTESEVGTESEPTVETEPSGVENDPDATAGGTTAVENRTEAVGAAETPPAARQLAASARREPTTATLLASVTLTQATFGAVLLAGVVVAGVPAAALGVRVPSVDALAAGVAVGAALSGANEIGGRLGARTGLADGDELRAALAPATPAGWAALLGVVLPTVALFEELLFRGALVGGLATGFGLSPWLLAATSSVAFALAHGAQGPAGVAVTGVLGAALAGTFVVTDSLAAVVVAHYLVNAVEFVGHEGAWG
ncbi:MAG: lysostaphin resistance A-like protein [Halolamina sp.]